MTRNKFFIYYYYYRKARTFRNEALNIDFQISNKHCYQNFDEFCRQVQRLQLTNWNININKDIDNLKQLISPYTIPYCDITIDVCLEFTVVILGWLLQDTHSIYKCIFRSVRNVTLSEMLKRITTLNLCRGLNIEICSEKVISYVIPCDINLDDIDPNNPFPRKLYQRPVNCIVLQDNDLCANCKTYQGSKEVEGKPLHINAPLSTAKRERLIQTIKEQRIVNKELTTKTEYMQELIRLNAVDVDEDLGGFIAKTMDEHKANTVSPFKKLFWEQQRAIIGNRSKVPPDDN